MEHYCDLCDLTCISPALCTFLSSSSLTTLTMGSRVCYTLSRLEAFIMFGAEDLSFFYSRCSPPLSGFDYFSIRS